MPSTSPPGTRSRWPSCRLGSSAASNCFGDFHARGWRPICWMRWWPSPRATATSCRLQPPARAGIARCGAFPGGLTGAPTRCCRSRAPARWPPALRRAPCASRRRAAHPLPGLHRPTPRSGACSTPCWRRTTRTGGWCAARGRHGHAAAQDGHRGPRAGVAAVEHRRRGAGRWHAGAAGDAFWYAELEIVAYRPVISSNPTLLEFWRMLETPGSATPRLVASRAEVPAVLASAA